MDFSFYINPFKNRGTIIELQFALDDPGGLAAESTKAFEMRSRQLDADEKLDVIKWYLSKCRFVDAEKLASQVVSETDGMKPEAVFVLGMAQLCRGDYQASATTMQKAGKLGIRRAAYMHVYISTHVLERADKEMEDTVREAIKSGEINESGTVAYAALGFCSVATNGLASFQMFVENKTKKMDQLFLTRPGIGEVYLFLCRKHGNKEEYERVGKLLGSTTGTVR